MITTAFDGFSDDFGRHNKELIVVKRDNYEIAGAIKLMVENRDHFGMIRSNAMKFVRETHDLKHTLDRYASLCHSSSRF